MFHQWANALFKQGRRSGPLLCSALLILSGSGCSAEQLKGMAYESMYQKNCMDRFGTVDCDPDHKTYDRYKYERNHSISRGS